MDKPRGYEIIEFNGQPTVKFTGNYTTSEMAAICQREGGLDFARTVLDPTTMDHDTLLQHCRDKPRWAANVIGNAMRAAVATGERQNNVLACIDGMYAMNPGERQILSRIRAAVTGREG